MTRAAAGSSSVGARVARGACAALLATVLLCVVELAVGAGDRDVPRGEHAWRLARDVFATLALLELGAWGLWSAARRMLPMRPATGFALLVLPLAVALTREQLGARLQHTDGGTFALLVSCGVLVAVAVGVTRGVVWIARADPGGRLVRGSLAATILLAGTLALDGGRAADVPPAASDLAAACAVVLGASLAARACLPAAGRATTRAGSLAAALALLAMLGWTAEGGLASRSLPGPSRFASMRTAPALFDGVLGLARGLARGGGGSANLLRSASAFDHEVWRLGNNPPQVERDEVVAPDGTRSADRVRFPALLSMIMQDCEVPARGRSFVARVWMRGLDLPHGDARDPARVAILIRAGTSGPYGQRLVSLTPQWTEYVFEHAFADDAPDDGVFLRLGNDHGDPRALDVALWDARLELRADDD